MSSTSLKSRVENFQSYPEGGKISDSTQTLEGEHTKVKIVITAALSSNNCTVTNEPSLRAVMFSVREDSDFVYSLALNEGRAKSAEISGRLSFMYSTKILLYFLLNKEALEEPTILFDGTGEELALDKKVAPENGQEFDEVHFQIKTMTNDLTSPSFTLRTIAFTLKDNHSS